ncbi:hypothetical protein [Arthrobacter cryoconiti]|uniref:ATP/GTP-binding protein n=1 Tax=Arthrobacter cryoconiti TaxID=748907 RepID=A0ABV8R438_9MICC|nr:hypothetical protein [Arthrobacter cryoconiti]MCC9069359.1 hypothetical protein [Arthrobacter cryoconiti]
MQRFLAFFLSPALIVGLSVLLPVSSAFADGGCPTGMVPDPTNPGSCIVSIEVPGGGGGNGNGNGGVDGGGTGNAGNPGTRECAATGAGTLGGEPTSRKKGPLPCTNDFGAVWDDAHQCYMTLYTGEPGHPDGEIWNNGVKLDPKNTKGKFYGCDLLSFGSAFQSPIWLDTPPGAPAVPPITPAEAAAELFKRFQFKGVDIGIVPRPGAGSQGSVGLPVWMWVNNPAQNTYGPWTQSDTIRGLAISGTAKVTSIDWNMGDGTVISCSNPGSPYDVSFGVQSSPDCGYSYSRMSKDQPGGKYPVSATSHWQFDWAAGGQTGTATTTAQSVTQLDIGEMQTVITK